MSVQTNQAETDEGEAISGGLTKVEQKQRIHFTRDEIPRLVGMFALIAALHVIGWGLFTHYNGISRIHATEHPPEVWRHGL